MFSQILHVHNRRVGHHLELLRDIAVLLNPFDARYARGIDHVLTGLARLGSASTEAFAKDHVVHNWLRDVRTELLAAYERGTSRAAETKAREMQTHFELALADMQVSDCVVTLGGQSARRFVLPVSGAVVDLGDAAQRSSILCRYSPASSEIEVGGRRRSVTKFRATRGIKIVDRYLDLFSDPTGGQYPVELDDAIEIDEWETTLECALNLVETNPAAHALVDRFVTYLVPLKQGGEVTNLSFSARSLPGVIFKNNELTPHIIGETLVHEADHQFFYAVEQIGGMWDSDVRLQRPVCYSPWRDDPRPLDGVLRGLSSFARVSQYYATLLTTDVLRPLDREAAGLVFAKRLGESEIALRTVIEARQLSAFGSEYVEDIQTVLADARLSAQTIAGFGEWTAHASVEIASHRLAWEATHQNLRGATAVS